jgi:hypothetical protein
MRQWGWTLIVFAALSALLPYLGMQLILMAWVDLWGPTIGWLIRVAFVLVGIGLLISSARQPAPPQP